MDPPPGSSALPVAMLVVMALNLLAICAFATFAFLERRRRRIQVESNSPDRDHKDTFITTHRLGSSLSCIKEDVYCRPQPARPLTPIGLSPSTPTFHNSPFSQTPYSRSLSPSAASVSASDISFHPLDAPKKKRSRALDI
ncbi:hypothetical protein PHLCEN_2v1147 [Hermanssonia centrifuga]|uniref:Uncharacterized protein n=1 Tax=Hermanssonia centrifuga TaxID=98765 RepID=A0A2R6S427_9APHY|nr:hypothetical protein PHLCEN_2v1147 [Hermanssonia centrifuga]